MAHPRSVRGVAAIVDAPRLHRAAVLVIQACERIERNTTDHRRVMQVYIQRKPSSFLEDQNVQAGSLQDLREVAEHATQIASLCKEASERASNVQVKRQFISEAERVAKNTANLISARKSIDERPNR